MTDEEKLREVWKAGSRVRAKVYDKLPLVFQDRLKGFAARSESFWKFENIETFACVQALEIIHACPTLEEAEAFVKLEPILQQSRVPTLDMSKLLLVPHLHEATCKMAVAYRKNPKRVIKMHGVLCPEVGCVEYGCWAVSANAN